MLTPYSIEKLSSEFPFLNWNDFFDSALHTTLDEGKLNLGFYLFSLNSLTLKLASMYPLQIIILL